MNNANHPEQPRSEPDRLLDELLPGEDSLENASFARSLASFHRGRQARRRARLGLLLLPALLASVLALYSLARRGNDRSRPAAEVAVAAPAPSVAARPAEVRMIGDEELLNLFRDRPVIYFPGPDGPNLVLLDETYVIGAFVPEPGRKRAGR